MINFVTLDPATDAARVLDLCIRAQDYIQLETGKVPDAAYVQETLTDKPTQLAPDDIFLTGLARPDTSLAGMVTAIRHFYEKNEWYIGLLLLDPAERSQGLGVQAAAHIFDLARKHNAPLVRIAVLDLNPRGRVFWERQGFTHARTVEDCEDGLIRHVLQKKL